jgi:hypothetical protein
VKDSTVRSMQIQVLYDGLDALSNSRNLHC